MLKMDPNFFERPIDHGYLAIKVINLNIFFNLG